MSPAFSIHYSWTIIWSILLQKPKVCHKEVPLSRWYSSNWGGHISKGWKNYAQQRKTLAFGAFIFIASTLLQAQGQVITRGIETKTIIMLCSSAAYESLKQFQWHSKLSYTGVSPRTWGYMIYLTSWREINSPSFHKILCAMEVPEFLKLRQTPWLKRINYKALLFCVSTAHSTKTHTAYRHLSLQWLNWASLEKVLWRRNRNTKSSCC